MNYFDDIDIISVDRVISRNDGQPGPAHNYWGIGLMLGDGYVRLIRRDQETKQFKMPFLYLIQPNPEGGGAWNAVDGAERDNRWFIAQGPRAERLITALGEQAETDQRNRIHLKSYQELIRLHDKMLHLFRRKIPSRSYQLAICLEEFAGAVYDALAVSKQSSPVFQWIAQTAEIISAEPGAMYDFSELARKQHISIDHFRRCFQEYAGKPVYEFLLEKRLDLAKNLLRNSTDSIKEISERCGFPRQAEFARFIRHRTGVTPSELRKQPVPNS